MVGASLASDWQPQGRLIGWEDGAGGLFLEPESSYTAVQEMGNATGEGVGISSATLRKRLHERGMLLSTETDKNKVRLTVRQTIGGKRRQVVHITNLLSVPEIGAPCAPVAPVGDNIALNQALSRENISKRSAPANEDSAPSAPEIVWLALKRVVARLMERSTDWRTKWRIKSAPLKTSAPQTEMHKQLKLSKKNITSVHMAHLAHVSEDTGEEAGVISKRRQGQEEDPAMSSWNALIEQLRASGLTIKVIGTNEIEIEGPEAVLDAAPVERN